MSWHIVAVRESTYEEHKDKQHNGSPLSNDAREQELGFYQLGFDHSHIIGARGYKEFFSETYSIPLHDIMILEVVPAYHKVE